MAGAVEPWLRGTHTDVEPVRRAVLHALELAGEDIARWCGTLDAAAMEARPYGLPSVGFQLRHLARSMDRLMTYAEGKPLTAWQLSALHEEGAPSEDVMQEFRFALAHAQERVLRIDPAQFGEKRGVGRELLPVTVAGVLIHVAEHTQRHVGQAITTAKLCGGLRQA